MVYDEPNSARPIVVEVGRGVSRAKGDAATPSRWFDVPASWQRLDRRRGWKFVRELAETVLLTLLIFLAVRTLIINFRVDGSSMQPALHNGEFLLVNKAVYFHLDVNTVKNLLPGEDSAGKDLQYLFHPPRRGDIVVFTPPGTSDTPFVKRVIALPGETVAVRGGQVYVNGQPLAEAYIVDPAHYPYPQEGGGELTVPPGMVFVLGDNRNNSRDSHSFGPVSAESIIGKAVVSYWPLDSLGLIPHVQYAQADTR